MLLLFLIDYFQSDLCKGRDAFDLKHVKKCLKGSVGSQSRGSPFADRIKDRVHDGYPSRMHVCFSEHDPASKTFCATASLPRYLNNISYH